MNSTIFNLKLFYLFLARVFYVLYYKDDDIAYEIESIQLALISFNSSTQKYKSKNKL